jgi:D-glycero-alpha-D-manno-heptose-7-phosphate kinase
LNAVSPPLLSKKKTASLAHRVETEGVGLQSGIQDQICAAYGGICYIRMHAYPHARMFSVELEHALLEELNRRMTLVFLGKPHRSSSVHQKVISTLENKTGPRAPLEKLKSLAAEAEASLRRGDLENYGRIMTENNEWQRRLHSRLIPAEADLAIREARRFKAAGWKVNGAGGEGGSLSILSSGLDAQRKEMIAAINSLGRGIRVLPVSLSPDGLTVKRKKGDNP